ncbi:MAG: 50S ribosomal protein L25 [Patescibacteria group bacterium]
MEYPVLTALSRSIFGKDNKNLRREKKIPAVIYGKETKSAPVTLSVPEFTNIWKRVGESGLIDLKIDNQEKVKVIIQEVQTNPLTGVVRHADLYKVNMKEPIETDIPLSFIGESPAVKELGGVLLTALEHLRVKALPGDLVHDISVSLDTLKTFEDIIRVRDVSVPEAITILNDGGDVLAKVSPPRSEEELKALDEEVTEDVESVEAVEKKVKEEDEEEDESKEGDEAKDKEEPAKDAASGGKEKKDKK